MSSNRLRYDECAYKKELCQSVGPLEYNLYNGKYENCNKCPSDRTTANSIDFKRKVEIENEIFNLDRKSSKCPEKKYNKKNNTLDEKNNHVNPLLCHSIHNITPSNLKKVTDNGIDEERLKQNCVVDNSSVVGNVEN